MNNISRNHETLAQSIDLVDQLFEASETSIDLIPKYIEGEVKKLGKIFNKILSIDENELWDGIHGIITVLNVSGNRVVNLRFEKSDFAKLQKIKGLRWLETKKDYMLVGWEFKP